MYIKTKNRIYKVESTLRDNSIVKGYNVGEMGFIRKDQVIKQSENIEELCDRFVVMDKETKEVMDIVYFLEYAKLWSYCKYNIYGAIWCEWGLKYVAKLDDKGDLELI